MQKHSWMFPLGYERTGRFICVLTVICCWLVYVSALGPAAYAQGDKVFSVPLNSLKDWSERVLVPLENVVIKGHSSVHTLQNDCEMHFGASSVGFGGDPAGLVLEPMNLCVEPFFGKTTHNNTDWTRFGNSLVGKKVKIEGVPRIWPEHLVGGNEPSNPNHAVEFHPLTKIIQGTKKYDFTSFIYAPESYRGGVGFETAKTIVEEVAVGAKTVNDTVEIDVDAARIGNFTALNVKVYKAKIESVQGGHRMEGEVVFSRNSHFAVHMVTVKGTDLDDRMESFKNGSRASMSFEALVLFSLSPQELYASALRSQTDGQRVEVEKPLQLILYGVPEEQ